MMGDGDVTADVTKRACVCGIMCGPRTGRLENILSDYRYFELAIDRAVVANGPARDYHNTAQHITVHITLR